MRERIVTFSFDDGLIHGARKVAETLKTLEAAARKEKNVMPVSTAEYNPCGSHAWLNNTTISLGMQNVFDEDPEALSMLIEKVNSPDFGLCFDTGHFNIFSTVPMEHWFESLGKRIVEVHLHDNDGTDDFHWALGKGDIDFRKFFWPCSGNIRLSMNKQGQV